MKVRKQSSISIPRRHTRWLAASGVLAAAWSGAAAAGPVCDADGNCSLEVSVQGSAPLAIVAPSGAFTASLDGSGFEIHGTARLAKPGDSVGGVALWDASLIAEYWDPAHPEQGFRRLHGRAALDGDVMAGTEPGTFGALTFTDSERHEVDLGIELGSVLARDLDIRHLNPNRPCQGRSPGEAGFRECPYVFFKYVDQREATAAMTNSDIDLKIGASAEQDKQVTLVLDPEDFYFYVGGSNSDFDSVTLNIEPASATDDDGTPDATNVDTGVGFSVHGYIPFEPRTTWGIEHDFDRLGLGFTGHLVIDKAGIPLPNSMELDGSLVMRLPYDVNGRVTFSPNYSAAGNGDVKFAVPLFKEVLTWELDIGDATLGVELSPERQSLFFSGEIDKQLDWMPTIVPLRANAALTYRLAGLFSNRVDPDTAVPYIDVSDSFIVTEGNFLLDLGFGDAGASLGGGMTVDGYLRLDATSGFDFHGSLGRSVDGSMISPLFRADGEVGAAMHVDPRHLDDTFVELNGRFAVGGSLYAQQGILRVTPHDAYLGFPASFDLDAILRAYEDIQQATRDAEAEVVRLNGTIAAARAIVQGERDQQQRDLASAQAGVDYAQDQVDSIQSSIDYNYKRISVRKAEIKSWKRWYDNLAWYDKTWGWAKYSYEAGWRNTEIAGRYTAIGTLEISLATARLALDAAKLTLRGVQELLVLTPIDLDPRVGSQILARDAALLVLNGLQSAMPEIPHLDGTIKATVGFLINRSGLSAQTRAEYCEAGSCIEIKDGSYDSKKGRACITIPGPVEKRVCTLVPIME